MNTPVTTPCAFLDSCRVSAFSGEWPTLPELFAIVAEVNRDLLPYQRIKKVTVLAEPLEMTTTKKIKRHAIGEATGSDG